MKKNLPSISLLAALALVSSASYGCSAFRSPSADYRAPGQEYCTDVSGLPDPNARRQEQEASKLRNLANQYGRGVRTEESPERLQMQADAYFDQKRYHDASRLYKKYLATSAAATTSPDILAVMHYRIGFVESKRMFFANAQSEYAQAVKNAPMNDEFLFEYGKASYEAGDYATADVQLAKLIARNPNYPKAQYYYGLTLLEGSGRDQAFAPLSFEVGQLEAYSIITDKYYSKGELQLAAQKESEMLALATQLGQQAPDLPHKAKALARAGAAPEVTEPTQPTLVAQAPVEPVTNTNTIASVAPTAVTMPITDAATAQEPAATQAPTPAPVVANGYMQIAPVIPNPQSEPISVQAPAQPQVAPEQTTVNESNAPSDAPAPAPQFTQIGPAGTANAPAEPEQASVVVESNAAPQINVDPFNGAINITNDPYAELNDDADDIWDDSAFATSGALENAAVNQQSAQQPAQENSAAPAQGYTYVAPSATPTNGYLTVSPHVPSASAQTPSIAPSVAPAQNAESSVQPSVQPTAQPVTMTNASTTQYGVTMSTLEYVIPHDYTRELNEEIDEAALIAQLQEIEKEEALEKEQLSQDVIDAEIEPDEESQLMAASTGYLPLREVAYRVRVARRNEQPSYETPWQTSLLETLSEATGATEQELAQNAPAPLTQASCSDDSAPGAVSEISLADVSGKRSRSRIAMTAHIGLANPGLFIASASGLMCRVEGIGTFRPGSIRNAVPREEPLDVAAAPQAPQVVQTPAPTPSTVAVTPNPVIAQAPAPEPEHARVMPLPAQTRPAPLAPMPEPTPAPIAPSYAARVIPVTQLWDMLAGMDRVDQLLDYYNQPTPIEFDEDDDDDFAFATSGAPQTPAPTGAFDGYQVPQVTGMFDDYQIPSSTLDLAPTAAPTNQASVNRNATAEAILVAQNVPTPAPQPQTQPQHSDESVLQIPANNTLAPTTQQPVATPAPTNATSTRNRSTPQERLQAAKASGAQVFELTPEQYRHVVTKGLGTPPPTK